MSGSRRGSRVVGAGTVRRLLRNLDGTMRNELAYAMQAAGPQLLAGMRSKALATTKVRTGALITGLSYKFYPKTLRLRIGFLGKRLNSRLFYARILEFGRRAQTVTVHRLSKGDRTTWYALATAGRARFNRKPAHLGVVYQLHVRAMAPRLIVVGRQTEARRYLTARLKNVWTRAISKAAVTGGNDD